MTRLSVVSFNACGLPQVRPSFTVRAREFCRRIEALGADVVNLQEIHTRSRLAFVRAHLPSLPYVSWAPGLLRQPRGDVVTLSRHPFASIVFHPFGGRGFRRGVLLSRLRDVPLDVANTHLSANRDGDWTRANRYHAMHRTQLAAVNRVCAGDDRLVATGDFNVASDSDLYDWYIAGAGWLDAFADDTRPTFHAAFLPPGSVGRRIDYVLTRDCAVTGTRLLFTEPDPAYLSDHAGLYVEFTVG